MNVLSNIVFITYLRVYYSYFNCVFYYSENIVLKYTPILSRLCKHHRLYKYHRFYKYHRNSQYTQLAYITIHPVPSHWVWYNSMTYNYPCYYRPCILCILVSPYMLIFQISYHFEFHLLRCISSFWYPR